MASDRRTWAGIDWLAGSVDLGSLLDEACWWSVAQLLCGGRSPLVDLDGLAVHLRAYGPKRKDKSSADEKGELVTGERVPFVDPDEVIRSIARVAFSYLFDGCGLVLGIHAGPGSFYAYKFAVTNVHGEFAGSIELGGELTQRKGGRPSLRFELTGLGCGVFEQRAGLCPDHAQRWSGLRAKLARVDALLTRIDVAYDDFDGVRNLALMRAMYEIGEFDYTFAGERKRPQARTFNDEGSGKGSTFYLGNSTSEKQLRVYEKGKQLGDPDSPWVRWEAQLRSSSRKRITLEILDDPLAYMRGAFACLDFVAKCLERLEVTKQATKASVKSTLRHAKRMYGSTFQELYRLAPDDDAFVALVKTLSVDKVPRWAKTGRLTWADVPGLHECPDSQTEKCDDDAV